MADNASTNKQSEGKKKQHFVSQFLLRNFSSDVNKASICLYNRETDLVVENAPVKSQAQESFFYGKDRDLTFEKFLQVTEERAAPLIRSITEGKSLSEFTSKEHTQLLHYVMLYDVRTKARVEHTEDRINSFFKELSKHDPRAKDLDLDNGRIVHPDPAAYYLAQFMDTWPLAADLRTVVIENHTCTDFFISDNPLVRYNPFMLERKQYWNVDDLVSKGLILLFPLSPKHYLMLYDEAVYTTSTPERLIRVEDNSVHHINLLQAVSADKIFYYSRPTDAPYVKGVALDGLKHTKDEFVHQVIIPPSQPPKKFLLSYYVEHELQLKFSFLNLTEHAKNYKTEGAMHHVRDPQNIEWVKRLKSEKRGQEKKDPG